MWERVCVVEDTVTLDPQLIISSDAAGERYILRFEGEQYAEEFSSLESALARAPFLVTRPTQLLVCDAQGTPLVLGTVYPNRP